MPYEPCGCYRHNDRSFAHTIRCIENTQRELKRINDISKVVTLKASGMSNAAIAREMGIPESSVRALGGSK